MGQRLRADMPRESGAGVIDPELAAELGMAFLIALGDGYPYNDVTMTGKVVGDTVHCEMHVRLPVQSKKVLINIVREDSNASTDRTSTE